MKRLPNPEPALVTTLRSLVRVEELSRYDQFLIAVYSSLMEGASYLMCYGDQSEDWLTMRYIYYKLTPELIGEYKALDWKSADLKPQLLRILGESEHVSVIDAGTEKDTRKPYWEAQRFTYAEFAEMFPDLLPPHEG